MPETRETLRWTIDAIEEGIARIEEEGERMITVPVHLLPPAAREGHVLRVARSATDKGTVHLTITIDEPATARMLERSRKQTSRTMAQSRKRDPGGDVAL